MHRRWLEPWQFPLGGAAPLTVNVRLELTGYQVALRGQASIARGRELAHAAGIRQAAALDALAGDPLAVDLSAEGPWLPAAGDSIQRHSRRSGCAGTGTGRRAGKAGRRCSCNSGRRTL